MQVTINNQPVWITYRTLSDISINDIMESMGIPPGTLIEELDPYEFYRECEDFVGWYFAACHPGCLPDGDFRGPYVTENEALSEAENYFGGFDE